MTRTDVVIMRLRSAAQSAKNGDLLTEAANVLQASQDLQTSVLGLIATECHWRVPLSDGVRAEVKIYGSHSVEHVKAFAMIFSAIAKDYQAPSVPATEGDAETEVSPT